MGYLTKQWSPVDQAQLESKQREMQQLSQEISAYRRKRAGKAGKPQIQFLSKKDARKKPSRVMWIRRKTKKRKSRLAKQKYRYDGLDPTNAYVKRVQMGAGYDAFTPTLEMTDEWKRDVVRDMDTRNTLKSQGIDTVYRRKHPKKKQKRR